MRDSKRLAELRRLAKQHGLEIEAVVWMTTAELAVRWNCPPKEVREIPHEDLPYLPLRGGRDDRRYHPADVVTYEAKVRRRSA